MLWGGFRSPIPRTGETNPRARAEPGEVGGFEAGEGVALPAVRLDWPGGAEVPKAAWPGPGRPAEKSAPRPRAGGGTGLRSEEAEGPGRRLRIRGSGGRQLFL